MSARTKKPKAPRSSVSHSKRPSKSTYTVLLHTGYGTGTKRLSYRAADPAEVSQKIATDWIEGKIVWDRFYFKGAFGPEWLKTTMAFIPFRCLGWEARVAAGELVTPDGKKGSAGSWSVVGPGNNACAVLFPRNGGEKKASAHVFTGIAPSRKPSADVFTGIAVSRKAFGGVFTGIATSKKASTEVFTGIAHSKKAFDDVFTGIKTS